MTTTPEYLALEARVTALESDYRRDLSTKTAALEQNTKALVIWSTGVDKRLDSLEAKVDVLDGKMDQVAVALDAIVRVSEDRWGQVAIGLEILRRMDAGE